MATTDLHEAGAPDERLQRHHRLQRGGYDHLEPEVVEDVHRQRGELVVGLVEGFIEHHRRVTGQLAVGAAELVAQRGRQTGGGQLLALAAGFACTAAVDLDLLASGGIEFDTDEFNMQAHVQHQLAPTLVLAFLRAELGDQLTQYRELRFGQFALLGLLLGQHVAQALVEIQHLGQAAVGEFDGQQGAAVERHLLQRRIDLVQALGDRLARLGGVALQGQQVVLALALQQIEEACLVLRQAVVLQPLQAGQEVFGAGQADGEVTAVFRPGLAVAAEAAQQQVLQPVVLGLGAAELFVERVADLPEVGFQVLQAEHAERFEAFVQALLLQGRDHALGQRRALLMQPLQAFVFTAKLAALHAHVFIGALGLGHIGPGLFDLFAQLAQIGIAFAQVVQGLGDVIQALQRCGHIDLVPAQRAQLMAGQAGLALVLALRAQAGHVAVAGGDALGQFDRFSLVQIQLVAVVEAEQPAAAVADVVAIVLLETLARVLDLAFLGDAAVGIAQVACIHAFVIEAFAQLAAQPTGIAMLAQHQLVQQRACTGLAAVQRIVVAAHPVIDQAGPEVGLVDPLRDLGMVALIDQQRLREAVQHALDGALPRGVFVADLQQFAHERQRRLGNAGIAAQARAQLLHRRGNAGRGALERFQFRTHLGEAAFVVALAAHALGDGFVQFRRSTLAVVQARLGAGQLFGEPVRGLGQGFAELTAGVVGLAALGQAAVAFLGHTALLALQLFDALAALLATLRLQFGEVAFMVLQRTAALAFFTGQTAVAGVQFQQARLQQGQATLLAHAVDAQLHLVQVFALAAQCLQIGVVAACGQQGFDLAARGDHRLVGAIEFGEIIDQPLGGIEGARCVEHEVAQEHIQIAEVLRRLGLVQQAQRHLVLDPEHVAEPFGVAGEAVEVMHIAQALLELAQVQVEAAEVARDVEAALGDHVVLAHIGCGRAVAGDPEQAHQADDAAVIAAVFQHQRGPGGALAQVLGGDLAGAAVLLVGPGATHVGD